MKKKPFFLLGAALLLPGLVAAQLVLLLTEVPRNTPLDGAIYVAGDFNGWQPGSPDYRLARDSGIYRIALDLPPGDLQFKFTRGSWPQVEGDARGAALPNRRISYRGGRQEERLAVQSWEDLAGEDGGPAAGTAAANVRILSRDFEIPQLNRRRRIWIYLPPDYAGSGHRYPVLYMQDGQNLFDNATGFAGEWQVDETLNRLFGRDGDKGVIVVGIDNGGQHRLNEYSPWTNATYGGGEGDEYARFLVETLKPYVDQNFSTMPAREHTGVMGSSMGGLISLFAALEYQDVFGRAGILSPSLWFSEEAFAHVARRGRKHPLRFYLMTGGQEGPRMANDLFALHNSLRLAGFAPERLYLAIHPDGDHNEWYWAREFGDVYRWLFTGWPESEPPVETPFAGVFPGGSARRPWVRVETPLDPRPLSLKVTRPTGQPVAGLENVSRGKIRLPRLEGGEYLVYLYMGERLLSCQKISY